MTLRRWGLTAAAILAPTLALAGPPEEKAHRNFTLVFVGGSGGDGATPTLARLETRLQSLDPQRGLVVFTGNYGRAELPTAEDQDRGRAAGEIVAHVLATRDFVHRGGKVYFLAGHTDFPEGGTRAVRRLRKLLNRSFAIGALGDSDDKPDVMPHPSCGDPVELKLTDTLTLVLLSSQWWMQDWANDPNSNEGCELKTRSAFQSQVRGLFSSHRTRRLVVASHHPLRSYGELGGAFSAQAHLAPAPIVGTFGVLARQAGLVPQYQNHPMVRSYLDVLLDEAQRFPGFVFASGHDASLQLLAVDRQTQLISGSSGHAAGPVAEAGEGDFAAASPGWAELEIEPSGAGEARFYSGHGEGELLFQKKLPALPAPAVATAMPAPFPLGPVHSTYTRQPVWQPGAVARFFIGSYYSSAYALELPYQTLDLRTAEGGLEPFKTGGGLQTNVLRAHDPQGGDWAIRSVTKDSSRALPYPFNQLTFVNRLIDHGFTATAPEGALAVPRLARAVGVLHSQPRMLYLPDQEGLGRFRGYLTDEVVLLEQRPKEPKQGVLPESVAGPPSPEGKTRFRSTDETLEKLIADPAKHRVDQEAMLRARLLDLFVGDWDRHRGQWTFAVTPNADGTRTYTPIAEDRDQAFSNYDGLGLALAKIAAPLARNLQPFRGDYGSVQWLFYSGRDLDPVLLNRIPRERWMEIATAARDALTDQVIDEAFATWHPAAYRVDGARLAAYLKQRREQLVAVAGAFFDHVNQAIDVLGSTENDLFELWFEAAGRVRVSVRPRDQPDGAAYFERVFAPEDTAELRLYALEGDDALVVHGTPHRRVRIRFVGGEGSDSVSAAGTPGEPIRARAIQLYDAEAGATIHPSIAVRDERSELAELNQYDSEGNHEPSYLSFVPGLFVNPDDGVYLGGNFTYLVHGYQQRPFAARHDLAAYFATATLGAAVDYSGLFPHSADRLDQQLELALKTPTFTRNFFGYTNRYTEDGEPLDYFRVRQARYEGRYGLAFRFAGDRTRVGAQLLGQAIVTEPTEGRFVTVSPDVTPDELAPRFFAGARLFAQTNTYDNVAFPRRGVALHVSLEGRYDVVRGEQFSINYRLAAATAIPFDRQQRFVLLTRARVEGIVGEHPFYFAPTLGAGELRAYPRERFAGEVAFAHSTDLRIDVLRIYSVVPGTVGVNLSIDHGRVFGASSGGADYHLSCGGGVWWFLLDTFGVSLSYHRSLEGAFRVSLAVGPLFSDTGF